MATHADILNRWARSRLTLAVRPVSSRNSNVWTDGDTAYSYGRHFPLVEFHRARRGRRRPLFLLNGDAVSVSTTRHQRLARDAVADAIRADGPADSIILPFSALDAAGIDRASIAPLEVRADRFTETREPIPFDLDAFDTAASVRVFDNTPTGARPTYGFSADDDAPDGESWPEWSTRTGYPVPFTAGIEYEWRDGDGNRYTRTVYARASVYGGTPDYQSHWQAVPLEELQAGRVAPVSSHAYLNGNTPLERDGDGEWYAVHRRHWLGDSLFTAAVVRTMREPCPHHVPSPDIGAVEWCETCGHRLDGPGTVTRQVRTRRRFLSSFDYQEPRPLYFLCETPRTLRPRTVDDAVLSLAPRAVHAAYARGVDVVRQGDIFAVATPLTDADVYGRARTRARRSQWTMGAQARAGEIGYIDAARRRADNRAAYRLARQFGWASPSHPSRTRGVPVVAQRAPEPSLVERASREEEQSRRAAIDVRWKNRAAYRARGPRRAADVWRTARLLHGPRPYLDPADNEASGRTLDAARAEYRKTRAQGWASPDAIATAPRNPAPDRYSARAQLAAYPGRELERVREEHRHNRARYRADGPEPACTVLDRVRGKTYGRVREGLRPALSIYGTAHTATEVVHARNGAVYVRGLLYHAPELETNGRGREPDHVRRHLRKGVWYLAIRNTVPRQ